MKYLVMIYCDDTLLDALPDGEFDTMMHGCFMHADELQAQGHLHDSQQLEAPATARTLRVRNDRVSVVDGPFAESKELIAGFWLWQVKSMAEAIEWVKRCPNPFDGESEIEIRQVLAAEELGAEFAPEPREREGHIRPDGGAAMMS